MAAGDAEAARGGAESHGRVTGMGADTLQMMLIPLDRQTEMPWKNGGGTTREIWKVEDAAGVLWRASIATIHQSGPFSLFEGSDRVITLIAGNPVALDFDDGEHLTLEMFTPQTFSCDRPVSATIDGTSHDLNLIWRREAVKVKHEARTLRGTTAMQLPPAHWHLIVACDGTMVVDAGGATETLKSGEALLFDRTGDAGTLDLALLSNSGVVIVFSISEID